MLIFYDNIITNPGSEIIPNEKKREASESLRQQATFLVSKAHSIIWYRVPSSLKLLPPKDDILKAHNELIGLSNALFEKRYNLRNFEAILTIRHLLNLFVE